MKSRILLGGCLPALLLVPSCAGPALNAETTKMPVVVCPEVDAQVSCAYAGLDGLQKAVDAAGPGAEIRLMPGEYSPQAYRDVPFQELHVRGALVIDGKRLKLSADEGAVLQGRKEFPVSAIVVNNSDITVRGLTISDFFYGEPEDDRYDGHGIFTIGSQVVLDDVRIKGVEKMALTAREDGRVSARHLVIEDSHLGIWLEEYASIDIVESVIVGSESAALALYGHSTALITNSRVDGSRDDGLYTEDVASIKSVNTDILDNSPYGARATGSSRIIVCSGVMSGNKADIGEEDAGRVLRDDAEACS